MQLPVARQSFNRNNISILTGHRKDQAAIHASSVEQYSAGTALPVVTSFFRADDPQVLTQRIQQRCSRIDRKLVVRAVYLQNYRKVHTSSTPLKLLLSKEREKIIE